MYAHIAVQTGGQDLDRPFTYSVPPELSLSVGQCVLVPFGRARQELGYVLALTSTPDIPPDLVSEPDGAQTEREFKSVSEVVDAPPLFDRATSSLLCWMARTSLCGISAVLRSVVSQSRMATLRSIVRMDPNVAIAEDLSPLGARIVETLVAVGGEIELTRLQDNIGISRLSETLKNLSNQGQLVVFRQLHQQAGARSVPGFRLAISRSEAEEWLVLMQRKKKAQASALKLLLDQGIDEISKSDFMRASGCSSVTLEALAQTHILDKTLIAVRRDPWPDEPALPLGLNLTTNQAHALDVILESVQKSAARASGMNWDTTPEDSVLSRRLLEAPAPQVTLLRGVTGSGKTEVYLRAIEETRRLGRQAIALVPEISLTVQMINIFQSRFKDRVAVLHSKLSEGERLDEWERVRSGQVDVVIGARSALFAPAVNLGLIVLDEEHEPSYKQDRSPKYLARDTAIERARLCGAAVLLASATPSLETIQMVSEGRAEVVSLPTRIDDRPLPEVRLVDQREELKENPGRLFSRPLATAIADRLAKHEQTILFLNRKGFATITLCRDCGFTVRCRDCDVTMTFYASLRTLLCHHCGYRTKAPDVCPSCGGVRIRQFGVGTEKVEEEVASLFPEARVARLDTGSTSRKNSARGILNRFRNGEIDILVGTQMVAKGLDFPGVTLVGVISADTMLNLPDFRAAERTFQLLTQVSGRAGRGDKPGEVVVQTFNPEHYAIQCAALHDYDAFCQSEMPLREAAGYPPFTRLANLLITGESREVAMERSERVACLVHRFVGSKKVTVLGPVAAPLSRIKSRYRWHLLLKCTDPDALRDVCRHVVSALPGEDQQCLSIDIDPLSLL